VVVPLRTCICDFLPPVACSCHEAHSPDVAGVSRVALHATFGWLAARCERAHSTACCFCCSYRARRWASVSGGATGFTATARTVAGIGVVCFTSPDSAKTGTEASKRSAGISAIIGMSWYASMNSFLRNGSPSGVLHLNAAHPRHTLTALNIFGESSGGFVERQPRSIAYPP